MMSTLTNTLRMARDLIVKHGWGRGAYGLPTNGPYCTLGAIMKVSHDQKEYDHLKAAFLKANPDIDALFVREWNDAPARTEADVLAAYDRAITLTETKKG